MSAPTTERLHSARLAASTDNRMSALVGIAILLLAVALGVVGGLNPGVGVLAAAGCVFVLIVMWDLAIGVCAFLLITFVDVLSRNSDLSLTKVAGALLVGSWLAGIATRGGKRDLVTEQPWVASLALAFLGWSLVSATWAESSADAFDSTLRFALNALLLPIIYFAVREPRHVVWLFAVFVVGALASVTWGLATDPTAGAPAQQAGRLVGARVEANALATLLIVAVLFSGALAIILRSKPLLRLIALTAGAVGLVAFLATFSRAGLVALLVVILVGVVFGGRWRRTMAMLALALVVVAVALLSDSSPGAAAGRVTQTSTSGRIDIWTVGWRMVEAHPVTGVGSGNFTTVESRFLLLPGTIENDEIILDRPYVAHNIYLHVMAEMGVIGLALFLAFIAACLGAAIRAVGIFEREGRRTLELLGRALVAAIIGNLAADFFASEQYSKQLWVLLALGPALLAIARESWTAHGPSAGTPEATIP